MTAFDQIMYGTRPRGAASTANEPEIPIWEESREEIEFAYKHTGICHHMAIALRRLTDLPLGIMWNGLDWHIEPDEDGHGGVRELVHIYVVTPEGMALDVMGVRPVDEMRQDMDKDYWVACPCEDLSEARLEDLVHDTRNLQPYDEADIANAIEVIRRSPVLSDAVARYAPADTSSSSPSP